MNKIDADFIGEIKQAKKTGILVSRISLEIDSEVFEIEIEDSGNTWIWEPYHVFIGVITPELIKNKPFNLTKTLKAMIDHTFLTSE